MEQIELATLEELTGRNEPKEQDDKFVIDDDHKANWALKKIRQMKKKKRLRNGLTS